MTRREVLWNLLETPIRADRKENGELVYGSYEEQKNKKIDQALTELEKLDLTEEDLEKLIPEAYCDVYPFCIDIHGYTKDGTAYKLKQERGKDLIQAILSAQRRKGGV